MPTVTKFYFHDVTASPKGTLPGAASLSAVSPTAASATDSTNRLMDEIIGTLQASSALTTSATLSAQTGWFRRFCSQRLAAQTLATGTWTMQLGAFESNASANMLVFFRVYVWRPSTGATVGTLVSASSNSVEPGTTQTNISTTGSQAGTQVILDGDVLIVEVWSNSTEAVATAFTETVVYDGTVEGSTTTNAAFITAPAAITLLSFVQTRDTAIEVRAVTQLTRVAKPRRGVGSRLRGPVVVFGPAAPTTQQLTIGRNLVAAWRRTAGRLPASKLLPIPFPIQFRVAGVSVVDVTLQAVARRIKNVRLQPHWELSGPTVLAQPPPTAEVLVTLSAVQTRAGRVRRPTRSNVFPPTVLQTFQEGPVEDRASVTLAAQPRRHEARSLVMPPTAVLPLPTQQMQTIAVTETRIRPRRVHSQLAPPILTAAATFEGPAVTVARTRPRRTRSTLAAPTTLQVFGGPRVAQARIRPRHVRSFLTPPAALQTFGGPKVEDTRIRPRHVRSQLAPPQVVAAATTFGGPEVTVARIRPRRTRGVLEPPQVLAAPPTFEGPQVTVARIRPRRVHALLLPQPPPPTPPLPPPDVVEDRLAVVLAPAPRRRTHSSLEPPTVLVTFGGPTTHLVRARPRPTAKAVRPPTVVLVPSVQQQQSTVAVHLAAVQTRLGRKQRPTTTRLAPPTIVAVASVIQQQDTVQVTLAAVRSRLARVRRGPLTRLSPPVFYPATSTIDVALAAVAGRLSRLRRGARSDLPVVIQPPPPSQQQQTVQTRLAAVRTRVELPRRVGRNHVEPPTVQLALPNQQQQTITVRSAAGYRRAAATRVFPKQWYEPSTTTTTGSPATTMSLAERALGPDPPQLILPLPTLQQQTVAVRCALRPRVDARRRAPRYTLRPPRVVLPLPSQRVQTIAATLAGRTRRELTRRAPHYLLAPPAVVAPGPTLRQQTVAVSVAWRPRLDDLRRLPRSKLEAPAAVGAPAPPVSSSAGGGGGFPPRWAEALLQRIYDNGVEDLDDEEVVALMMLGLL